MNKKQIIITAGLFIFVVLMVTLLLITQERVDNPLNSNQEETTSTATSTEELIKEEINFTEEVDEQAEESIAEEVLDINTNDNENQERLGVYTITVSSDGYSPDRLVITQGTIISLKLIAEGGDYDFYIPSTGNHLQANEGEEDQSSFRMSQTGTYRFECRDFCPSSGKISGELVVKSQ
ncbi:MAG: cupredoxin domain-containing protein [Candidatus Paceibacterota bacterium]